MASQALSSGNKKRLTYCWKWQGPGVDGRKHAVHTFRLRGLFLVSSAGASGHPTSWGERSTYCTTFLYSRYKGQPVAPRGHASLFTTPASSIFRLSSALALNTIPIMITDIVLSWLLVFKALTAGTTSRFQMDQSLTNDTPFKRSWTLTPKLETVDKKDSSADFWCFSIFLRFTFRPRYSFSACIGHCQRL